MFLLYHYLYDCIRIFLKIKRLLLKALGGFFFLQLLFSSAQKLSLVFLLLPTGSNLVNDRGNDFFQPLPLRVICLGYEIYPAIGTHLISKGQVLVIHSYRMTTAKPHQLH